MDSHQFVDLVDCHASWKQMLARQLFMYTASEDKDLLAANNSTLQRASDRSLVIQQECRDSGTDSFWNSQDAYTWKQTNYSDWNQQEDSEPHEFLNDNRGTSNGPCDFQLLRNYDLIDCENGTDRMEFYVNNLMSDCESPTSNSGGGDISHQTMGSCASVDPEAYRQYPLLETIIEETDEDLLYDLEEFTGEVECCSPSSSSEPWGWGWGLLNSDDDSGSVIHVPVEANGQLERNRSPMRNYNLIRSVSHGLDDLSHGLDELSHQLANLHDGDSSSGSASSESDWSECDSQIPAKKRRLSAADDCDDDEDDLSDFEDEALIALLEEDQVSSDIAESVSEQLSDSRSPSATESLIQFEALEKEIGDSSQLGQVDLDVSFNGDTSGDEAIVFRTSATAVPFEDINYNDGTNELEEQVISGRIEPSGARLNDCSVEDGVSLINHDKGGVKCYQNKSHAEKPTDDKIARGFLLQNEMNDVTGAKLIRAWSSLHSLASVYEGQPICRNEHGQLGYRRSWSLCDVYFKSVDREKISNESNNVSECYFTAVRNAAVGMIINRGLSAVSKPFHWRKSCETTSSDEPEARDVEDEDEEWEPDGYLGSDSDQDQCESSHSSDSDEYISERGDRFDESHCVFMLSKERSPISQKMRSYRSFDSLNLLGCCDEPTFFSRPQSTLASVAESESDGQDVNSIESNQSNSPTDTERCEQDSVTNASVLYSTGRRFDQRRTNLQRSAEALSEDSGYGDAVSGLLNSPESTGNFMIIEERRVNSNQSGWLDGIRLADDINLISTLDSEAMCQPDEGERETLEDDSGQPQLFLELETKDIDDDDEIKDIVDEIGESRHRVRHLTHVHTITSLETVLETKDDDQLEEDDDERGDEEGEAKSEKLSGDEQTAADDSATACIHTSALLLRRKPKIRPAPLSLREAEEFLNSDPPVEMQHSTTCHQAKESECPTIPCSITSYRLVNSICSQWLQNEEEEVDVARCGREPINTHENVQSTNDIQVLDTGHTLSGVVVDDEKLLASWARAQDTVDASSSNRGQDFGFCANLTSAIYKLEIGSGRGTSQQHEHQGEAGLTDRDAKPHANLPHLAARSSCLAPDELPASHNCADSGQNVTCSSSLSSYSSCCSLQSVGHSQSTMSVADEQQFAPRVVLKRYGSKPEVQVFLSKQSTLSTGATSSGSGSTISCSSASAANGCHVSNDKCNAGCNSGAKGVHFSPIVSAVNWRESYLDASDESQEEQQSEEPVSTSQTNTLQVVRVVAEVVPSVNVHKVDQIHLFSEPKSETTMKTTQENQVENNSLNIDAQKCDPALSTSRPPSSPSTTNSPSSSPSTTSPPSSPASLSNPSPVPAMTESESEGEPTKVDADQLKKKQKPPLFQRFSLARLSARMSATFSPKRAPNESKKVTASTTSNATPPSASTTVTGGAVAALPVDHSAPATGPETSDEFKKINNGLQSEKNAVKADRNLDQFLKEKKSSKTKGKDKESDKEKQKEKKEKTKEKSKNKAQSSGGSSARNFFSRKFYRSSSTPPILPSSINRETPIRSNDVTSQNSDANSLRSVTQLASTESAVPVDSAPGSPGQVTPYSSHTLQAQDQPTNQQQEMPSSQVAPCSPSRALNDPTLVDRVECLNDVPVADQNSDNDESNDTKQEVLLRAPAPLSRSAIGKPPLPPQARPRTFHARKNYMTSEKMDADSTAPTAPLPPPPVPVVSTIALQHALQHFKETARQDRERIAKSVPDLAAVDQRLAFSAQGGTPPSTIDLTPSPSRTSPMLLSSEHTDNVSDDVTGVRDSRCRARKAALSRASSVESAWNETLSKAAINLSRRNIAGSNASSSSNNNSSTNLVSGTNDGQSNVLARNRAQSAAAGLLETNLDNDETCETNLDELIQDLQLFARHYYKPYAVVPDTAPAVSSNAATAGEAASHYVDKKYKSMLNLGSSSAPVSVQPDIDVMDATNRVPDASRAKSMEFLLDDDNKSTIQIPENELQKTGERQKSEYELRVQRSLQKLNVPEWFKKAPRPQSDVNPASGLRRRSDLQSGSMRGGGWSGLSRESKTTSMTSLGSSRCPTPTRVVIPTRVRTPSDWGQVKSSRESLLSPALSDNSSSAVSPTILNSPPDASKQTAFSWSGPASINSTTSTVSSSNFQRWGSGRMSYTSISSSNLGGTLPYRSSLLNNRTPYLGWRSQDKLNVAASGGTTTYQTAAERLAQTLKKTTSTENIGSSEETKPGELNGQEESDVQSSIRQVTSAIVHYVTENATPAEEPAKSLIDPAKVLHVNIVDPSPCIEDTGRATSRSPSPRRQKCLWVESSFVGAEIPSEKTKSPAKPSNHITHIERPAGNIVAPRPDLVLAAGKCRIAPLIVPPEPPLTPQPPCEPVSAATLDDVLKSLLGLSPPQRGTLPRPTSQPSIDKQQPNNSPCATRPQRRSFNDLRNTSKPDVKSSR